jgi:hypothetical protein
MANPYPTGTYTQQETPDFAWRSAKSPISALLEKFRRCGVPVSTPHSSTFSRLDLELFSKSSVQNTFCESITIGM